MKRKPVRLAKRIVRGLIVADGAIALLALGAVLLCTLGVVEPAVAAPLVQSDSGVQNVALGAALATGLAAIGAGIAVGIAGAAAIGAMAEKPELLGRTLIIVGLAEGIAIYGLIISFMILTR
jgi:V/A-type H+-transporting ATPase subunit K